MQVKASNKDTAQPRIFWKDPEWEDFTTLYLRQRPDIDIFSPNFKISKAEFDSIQHIVIDKARHRTAYADVLKKTVKHMQNAFDRLKSRTKDIPTEPSWSVDEAIAVASELSRVRPDLNLLFCDTPRGYVLEDVLAAQAVLPVDRQTQTLHLDSVLPVLDAAFKRMTEGNSDSMIKIAPPKNVSDTTQQSLLCAGDEQTQTDTALGQGRFSYEHDPAPVSTLTDCQGNAMDVNDFRHGNVSGGSDCDAAPSAPHSATPQMVEAVESAPARSASTEFQTLRKSVDGGGSTTVEAPSAAPGEASMTPATRERVNATKEIIDHAASALEPLVRLFAAEFAKSLAAALMPVISPSRAHTVAHPSTVPSAPVSASNDVAHLHPVENELSPQVAFAPSVQVLDESSTRPFDEHEGLDEFDERLLRTENLHESRIVEAGWDHTKKPAARFAAKTSAPRQRIRIGIVGLRHKDAIALHSSFPDVEFTVIDKASNDISGPLSACDGVIGVEGQISSIAAGLLQRNLGGKFVVSKNSRADVQKHLESMTGGGRRYAG